MRVDQGLCGLNEPWHDFERAFEMGLTLVMMSQVNQKGAQIAQGNVLVGVKREGLLIIPSGLLKLTQLLGLNAKIDQVNHLGGR
jgi:hypothetical protein